MNIVYVVNRCLEVSEFELQSHYYVYFQINTIGKGIPTQLEISGDVWNTYSKWRIIKIFVTTHLEAAVLYT